MKLTIKTLQVFLVLLAMSGTGYLNTQAMQETAVNLHYSQGLISVNAKDSPLAGVLNALSGKTGIETKYLVDPGSLPRINVNLDKATLAQSLEYLLKNLNHMLVYDSKNAQIQHRVPKQIWILGSDTQQQELNLVDRSQFQSLPSKERSHFLLHLVGQKVLPKKELVETLSSSLIHDHSALVRTRAVTGLASLQDAKSIPALKNALLDESQSVRAQAILALGKIDHADAVDALGRIIQENTNSLDRNLAVRALAGSKQESAKYYQDLAGYDTDEQVRDSAKVKPVKDVNKSTTRHSTASY